MCLDGYEGKRKITLKHSRSIISIFANIGAHCEKMINKCEPNPCKNHGQCVPINAGDYSCNCPCGKFILYAILKEALK